MVKQLPLHPWRGRVTAELSDALGFHHDSKGMGGFRETGRRLTETAEMLEAGFSEV